MPIANHRIVFNVPPIIPPLLAIILLLINISLLEAYPVPKTVAVLRREGLVAASIHKNANVVVTFIFKCIVSPFAIAIVPHC